MASEVIYAKVSPKERVDFISEDSDTGKKNVYLNITSFSFARGCILKTFTLFLNCSQATEVMWKAFLTFNTRLFIIQIYWHGKFMFIDTMNAEF